MVRPKQYHVVRNSKTALPDGTLDVDGHKVKLSRRGDAIIHDPGLARAIDQKYGNHKRAQHRRSVVVAEVDNEDRTRERGHTYTFRMPGMPWHEYDELGRIVGRKKYRKGRRIA